MSRLDRIVAEHNQFSLGIKDLQDWMTDTVHMLDSYCHPTSDKSVLDSRMLKLEVCLLQEMSLIYRICFSQNFSTLHLPGVIRSPGMGTSLVVRWLGICFAIQGTLVGFPVRKLRFHMPWSISKPAHHN